MPSRLMRSRAGFVEFQLARSCVRFRFADFGPDDRNLSHRYPILAASFGSSPGNAGNGRRLWNRTRSAVCACILHLSANSEAIRPGAKLQRWHPAKEIVSQVSSNDGNAPPLQKQQHDTAHRDSERQAKEQSAIVHYHDAEDREMTE